jgi:hypothetical protein
MLRRIRGATAHRSAEPPSPPEGPANQGSNGATQSYGTLFCHQPFHGAGS